MRVSDDNKDNYTFPVHVALQAWVGLNMAMAATRARIYCI